MSEKAEKIAEKKAELVFSNANKEVIINEGKLTLRVEGIMDDLNELLAKVSNYSIAMQKYLKKKSLDLILTTEGNAYSLELEIY